MKIELEHKIYSPNKSLHWSIKGRNNKKLRELIGRAFLIHKKNLSIPSDIYLVRIAPRKFDDDNLIGAFKGIRDIVADLFYPGLPRGAADGLPGLYWHYSQEQGKKKEYKIRIEIKQRITNAT